MFLCFEIIFPKEKRKKKKAPAAAAALSQAKRKRNKRWPLCGGRCVYAVVFWQPGFSI